MSEKRPFGVLICRVRQETTVSPLKPCWYQLGAYFPAELLNALQIDLFLTNSFPLVAPQTLQQLYFQCFILASRCVIVFHFGFCLHFPQNMRSSIFSYVYSPFGYHPFEVFFWFLPIFPLGHLFSFICRSYILWIQVLCHIFVW